jgi:hypothetical protein
MSLECGRQGVVGAAQRKMFWVAQVGILIEYILEVSY